MVAARNVRVVQLLLLGALTHGASSACAPRDEVHGGNERDAQPGWAEAAGDRSAPEDARVQADAGTNGARDATLDAQDARLDADAVTGDGPADAASDRSPLTPLGLNDITILTPLPGSGGAAVLMLATALASDGNPLVPRDLFDSLALATDTAPVLSAREYEQLHLVALRFDLCDRMRGGTCAEDADGSLRLVFQPLVGQDDFFDAALHAFYTIPKAQLATLVGDLRRLAALHTGAAAAPLSPSAALSGPNKAAYAEALRELVRTHATRARLVRLAINAQPISSAEVRWVLRALERGTDGSFGDMPIAGSSTPRQDVFLRGVGYEVKPVTDAPARIGGVLAASAFAAASEPDKRVLLELLAAVDNPLQHSTDSAACVACHTSTVLLSARAREAGIALDSLSQGYKSRHDLSITAGKLESRERTLRALGYLHGEAMISRRVVNETAQVLSELEQRYGARP